MEKIGIIGGTFDPIHNGHLYIGDKAKEILHLDKIVYMVAGNPPHKKNKNVTDAYIRFNMVKEAIKNKQGFCASNYEIDKKGFSYTYETLEHFSNDKRQIYFITGADCLINIESWKEIKRIFKSCIFVVFPRPGYSKEQLLNQKEYIEKKYDTSIKYLDIPEIDESSTKIRELIKNTNYENVNELIPSKVLEIIKRENLYRFI